MKKRIIAGLMAFLMVLAVVIAVPFIPNSTIRTEEPAANITLRNQWPLYIAHYRFLGLERPTVLDSFIGATTNFADDYYLCVDMEIISTKYDIPEYNNGRLGWIEEFSYEQCEPNITNRPDDLNDIFMTKEWETVVQNWQPIANKTDSTITFRFSPTEHCDYLNVHDGRDCGREDVSACYYGHHSECINPEYAVEYVITPKAEPEPTPEPTPTPVIDQPPVDNAATLAPKIQVDGKPMSVQHSIITVTINGVPTELDAIVLTESNGGAHTYYKLRDVGEKVGFDVGWTPETGITVSTD